MAVIGRYGFYRPIYPLYPQIYKMYRPIKAGRTNREKRLPDSLSADYLPIIGRRLRADINIGRTLTNSLFVHRLNKSRRKIHLDMRQYRACDCIFKLYNVFKLCS